METSFEFDNCVIPFEIKHQVHCIVKDWNDLCLYLFLLICVQLAKMYHFTSDYPQNLKIDNLHHENTRTKQLQCLYLEGQKQMVIVSTKRERDFCFKTLIPLVILILEQ